MVSRLIRLQGECIKLESNKPYKRVLLKLSGEVLAGEKKTGIDAKVVGNLCDAIKEVSDLGIQVAVVVGGGNFWRGRYGHEMERTTADYMGMLATAMNGLALQDALEARGVYTRVQTAIEMREIAEPYIKRKAIKHLERGIPRFRYDDHTDYKWHREMPSHKEMTGALSS